MSEPIKKIPIAKPFFGGNEAIYVNDAVVSGEISGNFGKYISKFENEFSSYCGVQYGITTNNGTTALHLAMATLGLGGGDEVLVQTFTNMGTLFAVCYTGAKPVAIDIEPDTWNINPNILEKKITPKTKAIVVVHIFGHPVDMDPILDFARRHNLFVVEDVAEAHGAEYKGKKVGSLGDIGCFSFYANKIITTGEGGMLITNSKNIADKARSLHSLSYGNNKNKFMHESIGFNYRMSNIIAAFGCAQLENINKVIDMKRTMAKYYNEGLSNISSLQLPIEKDYARSVYWMYHVVLRGKWLGKRERVMGFLKENGVETRESFVPFNKQKIFIEKNITKENECPVANLVGENGFYLPSGPVISEEELNYTISLLKEFLK
jgi:perosamine synthetase